MGAVAGAIKYYDLPQLVSVQKPQSVLVVGPVAGDGKALNEADINKYYPHALKSQQIRPSDNPHSEDSINRVISFLK
jgi:hypothetical protein